MTNIDFNNLLESYPFTCTNCGHDQFAKPSLMMIEFKENSGAGSCSACKIFLHLEINESGERMNSQVWDEYLKARSLAQAGEN